MTELADWCWQTTTCTRQSEISFCEVSQNNQTTCIMMVKDCLGSMALLILSTKCLLFMLYTLIQCYTYTCTCIYMYSTIWLWYSLPVLSSRVTQTSHVHVDNHLKIACDHYSLILTVSPKWDLTMCEAQSKCQYHEYMCMLCTCI